MASAPPARSLSDLGAAVVVVGRSAAKTSAVAGKLRADRYVADFAHLDQVRRLARQLTARYPRIDVLVTGDGQELTFQVNHLAPFPLTTLLREPLTHSQARVITTASSACTSRQASGRSQADHRRGDRVAERPRPGVPGRGAGGGPGPV